MGNQISPPSDERRRKDVMLSFGSFHHKFEPLSRTKRKTSPSSSGGRGAVEMDRAWEKQAKTSSSYYEIKVETMEEQEEEEKVTQRRIVKGRKITMSLLTS